MTPKLALEQSNRMAITAYRHPLLQFPDQPLVLVEGKFDAVYIRQGLSAAGIKPRWRLADPDELTGDLTGGDAFKSYLKSRPDSAPIIVVRDWETKDEEAYTKHLKGHAHSKAVTMPESMCTAGLGKGWAGIERYLPINFIESLVPDDDLLRRGNGTIEPEKAMLENHKQAMARQFDITQFPAPNLVELARWIDDQVAMVLDNIPTEAFF